MQMAWDTSLKPFSVNCWEKSPAEALTGAGFKLSRLGPWRSSSSAIATSHLPSVSRRRKYSIISVIEKHLPAAF